MSIKRCCSDSSGRVFISLTLISEVCCNLLCLLTNDVPYSVYIDRENNVTMFVTGGSERGKESV